MTVTVNKTQVSQPSKASWELNPEYFRLQRLKAADGRNFGSELLEQVNIISLFEEFKLFKN